MNHETTLFNETLWQFYAEHGRSGLAWRQPEANGRFNPYKILVSELMLKLTQVSRVTPKFNEFLMTFPTVEVLASAPLAEVLKVWSGLGYNRRAKFLRQAAQRVVEVFNGVFPEGATNLVSLPGVGNNTAGAIMAYAFNEPSVFVETNIRTVYIHHFFHDHIDVPDAAIYDFVSQTLDHEHPREFYWALMDYGTFLKQTVGNLSKNSKTYTKQSKFEGSKRQIRGQILRLLAQQDMSLDRLASEITDARLAVVVQDLLKEQLISLTNGAYHL